MYELELITKYGRLHIDASGVLYNIAKGGEGGSTIDPTIAKASLEDYLTTYNCTLSGEYVNSYTEVSCICSTHGDFTRTPFLIKQAQHPCVKCSKELGSTSKLTTEEFIERSIALHGDKFTYSNTVYKTSRDWITITCRIHGDLKIRPSGHLTRGAGCKQCKFNDRINKPNEKKAVSAVSKYDKNNIMLDTYDSIAEAVRHNKGTNSANISACCVGKRKTHKGFIWKYN